MEKLVSLIRKFNLDVKNILMLQITPKFNLVEHCFFNEGKKGKISGMLRNFLIFLNKKLLLQFQDIVDLFSAPGKDDLNLIKFLTNNFSDEVKEEIQLKILAILKHDLKFDEESLKLFLNHFDMNLDLINYTPKYFDVEDNKESFKDFLKVLKFDLKANDELFKEVLTHKPEDKNLVNLVFGSNSLEDFAADFKMFLGFLKNQIELQILP
jgi:hypothetical protein